MAKNKRKEYAIEVVRTIDQNSGEIISEQEAITSIEFEREPDYVKLYLDDIVRLKDLPPASAKLLLLIVRNMGYNNIFQAYKPLKMMIIQELGITMNTLNQQISNLKKAGILLPMEEFGRGLYLVDPNLFARGSWKNIKSLRLIIDYHSDGTKTLKSDASKQLKQLSLFQE